jgi:hypothetical protein
MVYSAAPPDPTQVELLTGFSQKSRLLTLPANFRLEWKCLKVVTLWLNTTITINYINIFFYK